MSLWQGVDVPGDACQLVVIDRLPFPRPDEPLAAARAAAVDAAGGSGFAAVSVPIAAVRLAQGVGPADPRRTATGAWSRCSTPGWRPPAATAPFLRRSLPPFWYTTSPEVARGALERLGRPDAAPPPDAGPTATRPVGARRGRAGRLRRSGRLRATTTASGGVSGTVRGGQPADRRC